MTDDRLATIEEIRKAVPWLYWELSGRGARKRAVGHRLDRGTRHLLRYAVSLDLTRYFIDGIMGDPISREMGVGIPGETIDDRLASLSNVIKDSAYAVADNLKSRLEAWESFVEDAPND